MLGVGRQALLAVAISWASAAEAAESDVEVSGSLDRGLVREVVRSHLNEVRSCYEAQLTKGPGLSGEVAVRWVVDAQGAVSDARVVSSTGSDTLDSCVVGRVRTWTFPKPEAGGQAVVTYPFVFQSPAPRSPEASRPDTGWREVRTAHVVLLTDLSPDNARRAALAVERTRGALLSAAWPGFALSQPEHIEVVVFAGRGDFEHHFGLQFSGLFSHGDYPPTAFLYGMPDQWEKRPTLQREETTSVLRHELVHHLADFVYLRQPRWFAEGLAQFLETIRISEDGKTALIGAINLAALSKYKAFRTVTVADALAWNGKLDARNEETTHGLYGLSWLLVHWLLNAHPAEFAAFRASLVKGVDPDKAWKLALGSLAFDSMERDLYQYSVNGHFNTKTVPIAGAEVEPRERPLSSADVHAIKARVALIAARGMKDSTPHLEEARTELQMALADDPGHVRALRLEVSITREREARVALARRATAAHPEDGLAWLTLGDALGGNAQHLSEREQAYLKATGLISDDPRAFNNLAWIYVQEGKPQEALPIAVSAVQLSPFNPNHLDTLAAALAGVGRCPEAAAIQGRALDGLPEEASEKVRAEFGARLQSYKAGCGTTTAAP